MALIGKNLEWVASSDREMVIFGGHIIPSGNGGGGVVGITGSREFFSCSCIANGVFKFTTDNKYPSVHSIQLSLNTLSGGLDDIGGQVRLMLSGAAAFYAGTSTDFTVVVLSGSAPKNLNSDQGNILAVTVLLQNSKIV